MSGPDRERPARSGVTSRQTAILAVLCDAGEALSTTEVRVRVNRERPAPLVAEQVYRALLALREAGVVRRVKVAGSRNTFWEATVEMVREQVG